MTRSVVAASAADPGNPRLTNARLTNTGLTNTGLASKRLANKEPANKGLAHEPIKAIPGRNPILINRLPFLSCRCAVIDYIETADFLGPMAGSGLKTTR